MAKIATRLWDYFYSSDLRVIIRLIVVRLISRKREGKLTNYFILSYYKNDGITWNDLFKSNQNIKQHIIIYIFETKYSLLYLEHKSYLSFLYLFVHLNIQKMKE